jgi:pilus assembly protein CpaB
MNSRNIIIVAIAVFSGLLAVYLGNIYFAGLAGQGPKQTEQTRITRIVVATQNMSFGTSLTSQNVRLANWPVDSVPQGAFTSIPEATKNRVVLRPVTLGEPILASKVSGANGRATLSANLPEGLLAFTIPIGADSGVGGFVRPGDIVDVLLTRQIPGEGAQGADKMTDVVLQAVPVLGIDQIADEKQTQPALGKTATLQVSTRDAQKLALATKVGVLDLALRNVADQITGPQATVIPRDLSPNHYYISARSSGPSIPAPRVKPAVQAALPRTAQPSGIFKPRLKGQVMTVVRSLNPTEYEVSHGF